MHAVGASRIPGCWKQDFLNGSDCRRVSKKHVVGVCAWCCHRCGNLQVWEVWEVRLGFKVNPLSAQSIFAMCGDETA